MEGLERAVFAVLTAAVIAVMILTLLMVFSVGEAQKSLGDGVHLVRKIGG